ncbi:hypothetical protein [Erythrobacter sp. Alg231-14]|uniref:hypothetical protein n=1 Tax=Erythrobacter sp. Alg231-14 TaxID=1922225 RepID=UPI00307C4FD9
MQDEPDQTPEPSEQTQKPRQRDQQFMKQIHSRSLNKPSVKRIRLREKQIAIAIMVMLALTICVALIYMIV